MKKFVFMTLMALSLVSMTACGKTLKSDNLGIEITLPESGWKSVTDDPSSFVISKKSNMISFTSNELPEGYTIPKTEEELAAKVGEAVMEVSKVEGFDYQTNEDGSVQSLFYKQTLTVGESSSIMINSFKIQDGKLITAIATLTDTDEENVSEIENIIKSTELN